MAMIEAYRIGVELVLGGNLAAGVEALLPGLSRLDGSLSHANTEAKALATALGSVAATASGVGQAAGAMERLNAALTAMNRAAAQPVRSVGCAGHPACHATRRHRKDAAAHCRGAIAADAGDSLTGGKQGRGVAAKPRRDGAVPGAGGRAGPLRRGGQSDARGSEDPGDPSTGGHPGAGRCHRAAGDELCHCCAAA